MVELKNSLLNVVASLPDEPLGLLFSGGIDSTCLAYALKNLGKPFVAYTGGLPTSKDMTFVESLAWPFPVVSLRFKKEEVMAAYRTLLKRYNRLEADLLVPLYLMLPHIPENYIVFGSGTEELFAGYYRYYKYVEEFGIKEARALLWRDYAYLFLNEARLYTEFVKPKIALFPYTHPDFVRSVVMLDDWDIFSDFRLKKHPIGELGKLLGVPDPVINRKKVAFQYGSGVQKIRKRHVQPDNV